jgi:cytosine/adenosine deaminase-related metal-dependent hydrolase
MKDESTIGADYLFDGDSCILEDVCITMTDGKIKHIGKGKRKAKIVLESAVILPGLVNAHTHFELSGLRAQEESADFVEWLYRMRLKIDKTSLEDLSRASREGIREAIRSGTTAVVEHTNTGASIEPITDSPVRSVIALEVVGYDSSQIEKKKEWILSNIKRIGKTETRRIGLAPHSAYRASTELLRFSAELAKRNDLLISIHTSETLEEVEFFKKGTGRLPALLKQFGASLDSIKGNFKTPIEFLDSLGLVNNRSLLIHCNYPEKSDISLIKSRGAAVVYCPRSHSFFKHFTHPFEILLEHKIPVVFGTDSLASTPSLSILDELKFVKKNRPYISAQRLFSLATKTAAQLIFGKEFGILKENAPADFCAIKLPEKCRSDNVLETALSNESEVVLTAVSAKILFFYNSPYRSA